MGDELRSLRSELADDPRQRRDVDQWRTTALGGAFALFDCDLDGARRLTDRALPLSHEPWGEAGEVVHGLVHLLIDVLSERPGESVARWAHIADAVPSDAMRATRAWAEALWGDPDEAATLIEHVMPRIGLLAENFMGGFGLVGLAETALALDRSDWYPALIEVLSPLDRQMLGHPWAPSLAAADPLSRIHARCGHDDLAVACRDRAAQLYERLGADSLATRLATTA